jgi:hypothetical protein
MRRLLPLALAALTLGGCSLAGEPTGSTVFSDADVPFSFDLPADFTEAPVDQSDTRGDVVAAAGLTKVDVVAVRRLPRSRIPAGPVRHRVMGHAVTSLVHAVPGRPGWALECQYTSERRGAILGACGQALRSVRPR